MLVKTLRLITFALLIINIKRMNLHEYQGKEMLSSFGVRIQRGLVAQNSDEAVDCAKKLTGVNRN